MGLHRRLGRGRIAVGDQAQNPAVVGGRAGNGPGIAIARPVIGQQLAGIGLDQIGQKGIAGGDSDLLVKAQVQLVIGVRLGVAFGRGMGFAGADDPLQPGRARHRQTPRRQPGGLTLQLGMNLQNGEEFLKRGAEQGGALARIAADQTDRFKLQDRLAHRGTRHAEFRHQRRFIHRITGVQTAGVNPVHQGRDQGFGLASHPPREAANHPKVKPQNAKPHLQDRHGPAPKAARDA